MFRRFVALLFIAFFGVMAVNAQDVETLKPVPKKWEPTKYEEFLLRRDAVIVSQSHNIIRDESPFFDVSVKIAWELGQSEKLYAATINNQTVDFDQLKEMLEVIDRMSNTINNEFEKLAATYVSYSSNMGLSITYYVYTDSSGKPQRNLSLSFKGSFLGQGPSIEPLSRLRKVIVEAREKLISLGANKAG
ncbi:MAG TPA: hypothetical protein VF131_14160 [Blastocatellia bacterium]|nr:hypothetical protein [Blastocatellia bacterium]